PHPMRRDTDIGCPRQEKLPDAGIRWRISRGAFVADRHLRPQTLSKRSQGRAGGRARCPSTRDNGTARDAVPSPLTDANTGKAWAGFAALTVGVAAFVAVSAHWHG